GVFGVAFAFFVLIGDLDFIILVERQLRAAQVPRRNEEIIARRDFAIGLRRGIGLGLAAARHRRKGRADIGHFLHPLADAGEIGIGFDAAGQMDVQRTWLIPIDAIGANNIVDEPALLLEAAHPRRTAAVENGRKALPRAVYAP